MARLTGVLVAAMVAAVVAAGAQADGLPVLGVEVGHEGVARPDGRFRFVALGGRDDTLLAKIERRSDSVRGYRFVPGRWTIPAVAYDGSADGLSANGKTLVVVRPRLRFPRPRSPFALVNTRTLRMQPFTLRGDFSFDAISLDGRLVYLIEYTNPKDPTRYAVRLYDVARGRLAPEPIVDPHEPDEAMRGQPMSRAASPDGRWAYTLYDGAGGTPFVHALDTVGRTARCIDLNGLRGLIGSDRAYQLRLDLRGEKLAVHAGGDPFVLIDTRTFATSDPAESTAPAASASSAPEPNGQENSGSEWWILALTAAGLAGVLALALVRRRPTRAPS